MLNTAERNILLSSKILLCKMALLKITTLLYLGIFLNKSKVSLLQALVWPR